MIRPARLVALAAVFGLISAAMIAWTGRQCETDL
jgi:hypothetical protein